MSEEKDRSESPLEPYYGVTRLFKRRYPVDEEVEA